MSESTQGLRSTRLDRLLGVTTAGRGAADPTTRATEVFFEQASLSAVPDAQLRAAYITNPCSTTEAASSP